MSVMVFILILFLNQTTRKLEKCNHTLGDNCWRNYVSHLLGKQISIRPVKEGYTLRK